MARLTVRVGPLDGEALRKARTDSDRLIREVADEAGISKTFLNNLELGYSEYMSRPAFKRLAAALDVDEPGSLLADRGTSDEPRRETTTPTDGAVPDMRDTERPAGGAAGVQEPQLREVAP